MMRGELSETDPLDILMRLNKAQSPSMDGAAGRSGMVGDSAAAGSVATSRSLSSPQPRESGPPRRPQEKQESGQPVKIYGDKIECPTTGWEYMDPKGKKQGPFTLEQ